MDRRDALIAQHVADARKLAQAIHARAASQSIALDEFEQQACLVLLERLDGGAQEEELGDEATAHIERALLHVLETLASEEAMQPTAEFRFDEEQWTELRSLVDALPGQECLVIEQHYFHGRQLQHIANDMGLTKGRVSQIHQRALERLREGLEALREEAHAAATPCRAFII
ncbi:sigma-70 family RNA polymerase sigma factor [Ramlibacter sp. PS4R-6]|uniref:sigma-70 family RNA polymerase sigma factor n=1 Tax=Ramlibacter sp. PS4R-6 TaxID=3133438 RepID=UPI003097F47B